MTRRAIVNADDFGLSPGVNRGIVEALGAGVLSSTTMLVNLEGFADAARLAREHGAMPVGIHLSLLWGRPVAPAADVPTLVDGTGSFPSSVGALAARYLLRRLSLDEVRRELRHQLRRFLDAGLTPTHADTHKHVHCLPGILDAVLDVAREFDIARIRLPVEATLPLGPAPHSTAPRPPLVGAAKRRLIGLLCRGARPRIAAAGLRTTDHFVGIEHQACLNSDLLQRILSNLRDGVTEIMCHPGYVDEPAARYASTPLHREIELAALLDPRVKDCIASQGIRLIHYGEL